MIEFLKVRPEITELERRNIFPLRKFTHVQLSANLQPVLFQIIFINCLKTFNQNRINEPLPPIKDRVEFFSKILKLFNTIIYK